MHNYSFIHLNFNTVTWPVSRKRMGKHVAMERLIPGDQLIMEYGFQGYGN
jgi:hypothetical protein